MSGNFRRACLGSTIVLSLALAGCAADAWNASDPYGRALGQIYEKCGDMMVGRKSIRTLMPSPYNIDAYFEDATSRVFSGRMTRASYVSALSGFYGADPESPGVRCILEQIPVTTPALQRPPGSLPDLPAATN